MKLPCRSGSGKHAFNGMYQGGFFHRLYQISHGVGFGCPATGGGIVVCGYIHHRNIRNQADALRCIHTVHKTIYPYIHEDQIGAVFHDCRNQLICIVDNPGNFESIAYESILHR